MYESPITVFMEQAVKSITERRDDEICSYITEKFNVDVDKEELIKALSYDRGQYEKGYADGLKVLDDIKAELEQLRQRKRFQYKYGQEKGLIKAIAIIDKHIS